MTAAGAARAAESDPDWPCVQPLVPEMSYGLLWAGPPLEPYFETWDEDPARARIARLAGNLAVPVESVQERMQAYLGAQAPVSEADKAELFAGIFQTLNDQRSQVIRAIKRYSRGQKAALEQIAELLRQLDKLLAEEPPNQAQINATRASLDLTRQVFEDRRRALKAVCEQPVLIKQRLGDLLRTIQAAG